MFDQGAQSSADEDRDDQSRRGDGGRQRVHQRMDRWERSHGAIRQRVRQRTESNHDQQLQAVMLEREGQRGKAGVRRDQTIDVGREQASTEQKRTEGSQNGGGGRNKPSDRCRSAFGRNFPLLCIELTRSAVHRETPRWSNKLSIPPRAETP